MDSQKIKIIAFIGIAFLFAIYLGVAVVTDQIEALLWIGGIFFLAICLLLGRHIWILIPATLGMQGGVNFIPGSPHPWHLMTIVVGGFFMLRIFMRRQRLNFKWTGLDIVVLLVALTIIQAFVRNPTGLMFFGGEVAGGKPYFIYFITFAAFVLIGMADADLKSYKWAVLSYIIVSIIDGIIGLVSGLVPAFAEIVLPLYSNVSVEAIVNINYSGDVEDSRITQFSQLGAILGLVACSFWRPVAALNITKPWRGITALIAVVSTLLSGYRGSAGILFVRFVVGSLVRKKPLDVLVILFIGMITLGGLVAVVPPSELPYSIQRVLSVIPGIPIREDIAKEAKDSVDLRIRMWERALKTDRYIENKILGDGFGMKKEDAALMTLWAIGDKHTRETVHIEEILMASGAYHGFHAEVIRFTGVVGLVAATAAMIGFAIFAKRLINAYREQPIWGYVIFIGLPFLIMPFWYWFAYGDYRQMFPPAIAMAGMLKLLHLIKRSDLRTSSTLQEGGSKTTYTKN